MAVFPALTHINANVIKKINNTSKESFSGNKPFITLTNFIDGEDTINYESYTSTHFNLDQTDAKNANQRFPAIITGLDVGTSGNLGTVRKAKITIKFASMTQFANHKNFFKIGHSQLVTWGWLGNSITTTIINKTTTAKNIINNIKNWQEAINNHDNEMDFLAGILINFDIKMNADATVDVTLQLGAPSEIPGYLSLTRKDKTSSVDSDTSTNSLAKICKALDLDGQLQGTSKDEIKAHTVNYTDWVTVLKTTGAYAAAIPDAAATAGNTASGVNPKPVAGSDRIGTSDQNYIQLGFAIQQICNHNIPLKKDDKTLELAIDLDNAVAMGHPNMISVSENVLFPNRQTMGFFTGAVDSDGVRLLIPDTTNTQAFGPFNKVHEFPVKKATKITHQDGTEVQLDVNDYFAGYIKDIYISTQFLIDAAKGVDTIFDFLQKIVDELNVAGAGLYNLVVKGDASNKYGKEILSIEDLHFMHDKVASPPELKIFTDNSRIIDLSLNVDLPKAIIGELMLSKDTTGTLGNPGLKMFTSAVGDTILKKADENTNAKPGEGNGFGIEKKSGGTNTSNVDVNGTPVPTPGGDAATSTTEPPPQTEPGWWEGLFNMLKTQWLNMFNLAGPNRVKFANSENFGDGGENAMFGVYKDVSVVKTIYNGEKNKINRQALVPITLNMSVLGLGGITIGSSVSMDPTPAPWLDGGSWQVTNVEHKVDSSNWTTNIEFKYRVKT